MTDLTDAYDRAIGKLIDAGLFTAEQIASEQGAELLHAIQCDQRDRLIRLGIPGLVAPKDYDYSENSVLYKLQKSFNDVAGLNDVRVPLQAAAEETLAVMAARGASAKLAPVDIAEEWKGDGVMEAANKSVNNMFAAGFLWPQCFGFDKGGAFPHHVFVAQQLRFIGSIPGFDVAAEQLEYDKKVVRNIHEVNNKPGLSDVRPLLDNAVEETLVQAGLKPATRITVPKPVKLKTG
jgi:hypothetical protein